MKLTETDDTLPLFVWDTVEAAITIVAASIPVLRVLVRDVRTKSKMTAGSGFVSAGYELSGHRRVRGGSEKSMLDVTVVEENGAILRTDTFSVAHSRQGGHVELGRPFGPR